MANFPASLPSFTITAGSETANGAAAGLGLSGLLNSFEGEITAVATKVGTGSSVPAAATLLYGTGAGTSAWQGLTSAQLLAIISDETGTGALVFASSPTIVTPTIASFTNAQHDHSGAAGGGTLNGGTALQNSTVTSSKLNTGSTSAAVAAAASTTSTSYTPTLSDSLTTSVTVTIGANGVALLVVSSQSFQANNGAQSFASFSASGANTIAASDANALAFGLPTVGSGMMAQFSKVKILTGLTPGSTTFTLAYRVSGGTGTFTFRDISVVPL